MMPCRLSIPEEREDDTELRDLMLSYAEGRRPYPETISPDEAECATPCSRCGQVAWGDDVYPVTPAIVFTSRARVSILFCFKRCATPGCLGELHVDGRAHGLLRKSKGLAFAYDMLYDWVDKCGLHVRARLCAPVPLE